jgi:predicted TIM-barrel fold metal-dependent hydrolase
MAKADQEAQPDAFTDRLVVDCDVHMMNGENIMRDVAKQMEEPYKSQLDPDTGQGGLSMSAYPSSGYTVSTPGVWSGSTRGIEGPEDIREPLCEEFGVDHPIINTGTIGVNFIPEPDRAEQEMRAKNNVLLDMFLDDNPDWFGLATLRSQEPDKAAEEIDRMGDEEQIVGCYIALPFTMPPLGDPQYDVMYEAAEDNDLMFMFHSGGGLNSYAPNMPRELNAYLQGHTISHPVEQTYNLVSMIYEGVPEKFPDLNFVCQEAGLGWAAYLMGRMNRDYSQRRFDAPLLEKSPEEYVRDSWYFTTQPMEEYNDPTRLRNTIDTIGPESIVFSSDHPHFDFDYPANVAKMFDHLDDEDIDKVFHQNAIDAFNLPV